jgi:uncharacterized protein
MINSGILIFSKREKPFTGCLITWYKFPFSGRKRFINFYRNGLLDSIQSRFYRNGKQEEWVNYSQGKTNGSWVQYYKSGQVKSIYDGILDDTLMGRFREFYDDSYHSIKMAGTYLKGMLYDSFIWYYPERLMHRRVQQFTYMKSFHDLNGTQGWTYIWDRQGRLNESIYYENGYALKGYDYIRGKMVGEWKTLTENGKSVTRWKPIKTEK